ncbi:hypothetical protein [Oceanidesulfovibrio marinus]|uniref:Uncharacterized protein n=1 Tax=Oceanidesulfovibrio marinus TaxID=370038 RepID=A0A6P1ZHE6_9BACT|nr:hypothetical protein [Oceanidesulfovibrio marinus]TVM32135.1 hypothetical protein DQK91_16530 [Oceanidesulfovibrio marinus]
MATEWMFFKTALEVTSYLNGQGYKCSKSTVYGHVKKKLLRKGLDGQFSKAAVDRYAKDHLERLGGFSDNEERTERARVELLESKAQKSKAEAELAAMKLQVEQGKLIPVEDVDTILSAAVTVLRASMLQFFYGEAASLIHLVEGNPAKTGTLVEHMRKASFSWFNSFAKRHEFMVDYGASDAAESGALAETTEDAS